MALKTFTATRPPAAGEGATRQLASWHISAATQATVNFCEETAATVIFQVQVPATASASQAYPSPLKTPGGGRWHIEVVAAITRGAIDLI